MKSLACSLAVLVVAAPQAALGQVTSDYPSVLTFGESAPLPTTYAEVVVTGTGEIGTPLTIHVDGGNITSVGTLFVGFGFAITPLEGVDIPSFIGGPTIALPFDLSSSAESPILYDNPSIPPEFAGLSITLQAQIGPLDPPQTGPTPPPPSINPTGAVRLEFGAMPFPTFFAQPETFAFNAQGQPNITDIDFGDFDLDGDIDIFVTAREGKGWPRVVLNEGDGSFVAEVIVDNDKVAYSVDTGDFNNDGVVDLLVGSTYTGTLDIWWGGQGLDFPLRSSVPELVSLNDNVPSRFLTGDFDRDGNQDVVIYDYPFAPLELGFEEAVAIFRGDGTGGFGTPLLVDSILDPLYIRAADMDQDGTDEIVVGLPKKVRCYDVDWSDLTLIEDQILFDVAPFGSLSQGLEVGDLSGDGYPDIHTRTHFTEGVLGYLRPWTVLNDGTGGLDIQVRGEAIHWIEEVVLDDLNQDGYLDVVTSVESVLPELGGYIGVHWGKGAELYSRVEPYPDFSLSIPGHKDLLRTQDLNGDGLPEVLVRSTLPPTLVILQRP